MNTLRAIIVEDEQKSQVVLKYLIDRNLEDRVEVVDCFSSPEKAIGYLNRNPVDLVFLDIQMPGINGFEMLDKLNDIEFDLIFTTAFNNYATKAFRYYAVDYLLKPVIAEELVEAVRRVEERNVFRYNKQDLSRIFRELNFQEEEFTRLAVPTREGVEFISLDTIIRLEADGNYTRIFMKSGMQVYTSKTMKYFEQLLPPERFYRPHNSHIIAVPAMKKYVKTDGGYILLSDGSQVPISRSRRQEFSDRFY